MSASFRSPKSQAQYIVRQLAAHGVDRHRHKGDGLIHSIGTERATKDGLAGFAAWLSSESRSDLRHATYHDCVDYLKQRSENVAQKTLNSDRQALNRLLSVTCPGATKLPAIRSELPTILCGRAYTAAQVAAISEHMSPQNQVTCLLAFYAGLRAHEALTIRPCSQQPRSDRRQWRSDLQHGRGEYAEYTVVGKGGLVRSVFLPPKVVNLLESRRLSEPMTVVDRGIKYHSYYDIGGGQRFSQSFSAASVKALGYSLGAHGCRHSFVQDSLERLKQDGYSDADAREVVGNLVGHFRDVIGAYLR